MSGNEPDEIEKAALEVVRAVVDVTDHERLVPSGKSGDKTGDWRVWMADESVADVEVTTNTDGAAMSFFAALSVKGSGREWPNPRLSHKWTVIVADHRSRVGKRNLMKELVEALCDRLVCVEAVCDTPAQMVSEAGRQLIGPETYFNRLGGWRSLRAAERRGVSFEDWCANNPDYWYPQLLADHYKHGRMTQDVRVIGEPEPLGEGQGMVKTIPSLVDGGSGCDSLAPAIQEAIDMKTQKRQLDGAPGFKWLAVMLDGIPGSQLWGNFGPVSQGQPPTLDSISFAYFDEVWAVACVPEAYTVLRISDGGARQHHHVVSRSQPAASG